MKRQEMANHSKLGNSAENVCESLIVKDASFVLKQAKQFKSLEWYKRLGKPTLKWNYEIAKISNDFSTSLCVMESGCGVYSRTLFLFAEFGVFEKGPFLQLFS